MIEKLLHKALTQEIIGAFYTVYNEFGYGFLEHVYKNALALELGDRNYLRASNKQVGLLLHFGPKPVHKRFVWTGRQFNSHS